MSDYYQKTNRIKIKIYLLFTGLKLHHIKNINTSSLRYISPLDVEHYIKVLRKID